jgi:hypothetical protein
MAVTIHSVSAESLYHTMRLTRRNGGGSLGSAGPKRRHRGQRFVGEDHCATIKEHDGLAPRFALQSSAPLA